MASLVTVVSAVLVLSYGQTDRITHTHTNVDDSYIRATPVGVSNYNDVLLSSQAYVGKIPMLFIAERR